MPAQNEEEPLNRVLRKTPLEHLKHKLEEEHFELVEKMSKLFKFIYGIKYQTINSKQQDLLVYQLDGMKNYANALISRIIDLEKQIKKERECTKDKSLC